MVFLTQIVTEEEHWDTPDSDKMGHIPIYLRNEVRLAKPIMNPFELKVPTKEFAIKYGSSLGIYVYEDTSSGTIWWTGFCLYKNNELFQEFVDNYPYVKINHVDEMWLEYFSSVKGEESWEVKSFGKGDYSSMKLDVGRKIMTMNNGTINGLQFDKDRAVFLEKNELLLGGFRAEEPAVLGNKIKSWLEDLIDAISTETHTSGSPGSPTSVPLNSSQYSTLKSRIPEILSALIKISK